MDTYDAVTASTGATTHLPQPYTTYGIGLPQGVPDTRFPANLPNGPFQISKYVPYAAYTGDPVHRFFQMWQDVDGGKHDKFVWVEETIGTGSNGAPPPAGRLQSQGRRDLDGLLQHESVRRRQGPRAAPATRRSSSLSPTRMR